MTIAINLAGLGSVHRVTDSIKQGETKTLQFSNVPGTASLSGATFCFIAKQQKAQSSPVIESTGIQGGAEGQWDFTNVAQRNASLTLRPIDTRALPGEYTGEVSVKAADGTRIKSKDIKFSITQSVLAYTTTTTTSTTTTTI